MSEQPPANPDAPPIDAEAEDQEHRRVVARYGRMGHVGAFSHELDPPPKPDETVVLHTDRGTELGKVLIGVGEGPCHFVRSDRLDRYVAACGTDYPFSRKGKVLRVATAQDFNDQQHLDKSAQSEAHFCRKQIDKLGLEMKIVDVEHLLGGERIVFFFTAEHRVDFRELVRLLAAEYHTRIEMRQVGARDEARLMADYERCGRRCCCQEFLKFLKPVSMRMAKTQKATLDPAKISGRCGRLMCCLRYEDAVYSDLQAALPGRNTWVRTADGTVGKVVELQVLTQLVRLILSDREHVVVAIEEIVERDVPEPSGPEEQPRLDAAPKPEAEEAPEAGADEAGGDDQPASPKRRKRRRGRRGGRSSSAAAGQAGSSAPPPSPAEGAAQASRKKRRRRRRPGRKGGRSESGPSDKQ